jgi:hypothetical protein
VSAYPDLPSLGHNSPARTNHNLPNHNLPNHKEQYEEEHSESSSLLGNGVSESNSRNSLSAPTVFVQNNVRVQHQHSEQQQPTQQQQPEDTTLVTDLIRENTRLADELANLRGIAQLQNVRLSFSFHFIFSDVAVFFSGWRHEKRTSRQHCGKESRFERRGNWICHQLLCSRYWYQNQVWFFQSLFTPESDSLLPPPAATHLCLPNRALSTYAVEVVDSGYLRLVMQCMWHVAAARQSITATSSQTRRAPTPMPRRGLYNSLHLYVAHYPGFWIASAVLQLMHETAKERGGLWFCREL